MKIIKKNVYYCDFCKKKGLSAGHMKSHEEHCTGNINRKCRMCEKLDIGIKNLSVLVKKYKSRYEVIDKKDVNSPGTMIIKWIGKEIKIAEIIDDVEGCPMCVLTILRHAKLNRYYFDIVYDYKKELSNIWADINYDNKCREEIY